MKSTVKFYLIVFLSVSLFAACGDTDETTDVSVNVVESLNGSWQSTKVLRSGNETDMGPFSIGYNSEEGIFTSNLFTAGGKLPYESGVKTTLNGYSLSFENLTDTFYIDSIDDKNLVISSTIQNFPFEFTFEKVE